MPNLEREGSHRVLAQLHEGARATISSIPTYDGITQDLVSLRLFPGEEIEVVQVLPRGGPVLVRTGESVYALGRTVAEQVLVLP